MLQRLRLLLHGCPLHAGQHLPVCTPGPCVALKQTNGRLSCGRVSNPLGYLYQTADPDFSVSPLDQPPDVEEGHHLSVQLAAALGVGQG